MLVWGWLAVLFGWLFVLGSAVGSFLNVCVYRLPRGRNLFWPSSRCGSCFTPIRARDNLPLLAYWRLGGRCRTCGARFSVRYFLVELIVGFLFAGLYFVEIGANVHGFDVWIFGGFSYLESGRFPPDSWAFFVGHIILASALVVAIGCLLDGEKVPRGLVVFGAVCGLAWSLMYPWPTPSPVHRIPTQTRWAMAENCPRPGFVPWPVWERVEQGSFEMGLLSAAAGILLPAGLVRLADRRRRLGNAAGILTMTGGFLGWQPLAVALALTTLMTLGMSTRRRVTGELFAFLLALYLIVLWLGWAWLGPLAWPVLSDGLYLGVFVAVLTPALAVVGRLSGKGLGS